MRIHVLAMVLCSSMLVAQKRLVLLESKNNDDLPLIIDRVESTDKYGNPRILERWFLQRSSHTADPLVAFAFFPSFLGVLLWGKKGDTSCWYWRERVPLDNVELPIRCKLEANGFCMLLVKQVGSAWHKIYPLGSLLWISEYDEDSTSNVSVSSSPTSHGSEVDELDTGQHDWFLHLDTPIKIGTQEYY